VSVVHCDCWRGNEGLAASRGAIIHPLLWPQKVHVCVLATRCSCIVHLSDDTQEDRNGHRQPGPRLRQGQTGTEPTPALILASLDGQTQTSSPGVRHLEEHLQLALCRLQLDLATWQTIDITEGDKIF
jgi:hypothetical protein